MAPDWRRARALFDGALDLAPEVRSAYLQQVCAGDLELQNCVERLLAVVTEEGSAQIACNEAPIVGSPGSGGGAESLRRNRMFVGLLSMLALAIVGASWQWYRADRACQEAERQRARAEHLHGVVVELTKSMPRPGVRVAEPTGDTQRDIGDFNDTEPAGR